MASMTAESNSSRIYDIIKLEFDSESEEARASGESIRLECSTDFGLVTIVWISAGVTIDLLRMEVIGDNNKHFLVLTPASKCSFRFSRYKSLEELSARVVVGFKPKTDER